METKYPRYDVYEKIYKRYLKRDLNELISLGEIKSTDQVIDLCGGNARLTKELSKYTKFISYLDQESDMIPSDLSNYGVKVYNMSIEQFLNTHKEQYDKVFCQQAINYWLLHVDMNKFSSIFKPNGLFIFNTFANKPSLKPMIKQYQIDNEEYLEISYLLENKVYHIQIKEGYEPHFTVFDWIDEDTYDSILSPYFEIEKMMDGKTFIYKCRRKYE